MGSDSAVEEYDVIIIGAGVTGIYQTYRAVKAGFSVKTFEAGTNVGGTWYWNRYPGARFDSESYIYGYTFSEELQQEWDWKEQYSAQPETEKYLNFVTDKFDLRRHMQFETRIDTCEYSEDDNEWTVTTQDGKTTRSQFVVASVGILSQPHFPAIEGIESFQGDYWHSSHWPKEAPDFSDKRVGVIGCGATAIQLFPEVAKTAKHLTMFQRSANWACPLRNSEISDEEQKDIKSRYPEIKAKMDKHFASFMYEPDPRSAHDVSPEEREEFWEEIWAAPGFKKWFGNFHDIFTDEGAANLMGEFAKTKIRERVNDPEVAELLCPNDHPFGTKRLPLETGYYEAYNQPNVKLKDVKSDPIEEITPTGLKTGKEEFELDVIIYATGFDAISGSLTRMDIRGKNGSTIRESWAEGPRSVMGVAVPDFPNFFITNGAVFCNTPTCSALQVDFAADCMEYLREKGARSIEATRKAEEDWLKHSAAATQGFLFEKQEVNSWFMGTNVPGKARVFLLYAGGAPAYRESLAESASSGYDGFAVS